MISDQGSSNIIYGCDSIISALSYFTKLARGFWSMDGPGNEQQVTLM
jgi:hypothetical protein